MSFYDVTRTLQGRYQDVTQTLQAYHKVPISKFREQDLHVGVLTVLLGGLDFVVAPLLLPASILHSNS